MPAREITDGTRRSFLDALDDSDSITPSDWEIAFLNSTMEETSFTPKQRAAIDRMISKYGDKLAY